MLVAHLGGFKYHEKYILEPKYEGKTYYDNHLGRLGLAKINSVVKPNRCIISEFGEEFKGCRIRIAEIYNKAFGNQIEFIPADIGLKFNFNNRSFNGLIAFDIENSEPIYGDVRPDNLNVCEIIKYSSLYYYDKTKFLKESDLTQILTDYCSNINFNT